MNQHQPTAADFFAQPAEDDEPDVTFQGVSLSPSPDAMWQLPPSPLERIAEALESLASLNVKLPENVGMAVAEGLNKVAATSERVSADDASTETGEEMHPKYLYDDLVAKYDTVLNVIHDVEAALGKSTAKPALAAKAVIEEWRNPKVPSVSEGEVEPSSPPVIGPITSNLDVHTRAETDAGPDICQECSYAASDWIQWPCEAAGGEPQPQLTGPEEGYEPVQPAHDAPVEEWREYARAQGLAGPHIDRANRSQIRTALGIAQPVIGGPTG